MKNAKKRCIAMAAILAVTCTGISAIYPTARTVNAASAPMVEYLNRGISAVNTGSGMLVSWRFLASDPDDAVFKLYRDNNLIYTSTEKANGATCFLDKSGNAQSVYKVEAYSGTRMISSETCNIQSSNSYFDVKLEKPANGSDGGSYSPNDMSVGDVDGDGQYELFVKWDPSTSKDNSQKGKTDKVYIDCYRLDGTKLWRIDLGVNIRAGAHYTQFYVADFDLDGKCEMTCKTSDGTVDGTGKVIGDASKVYRDSSGLIYSGNEFYTLFDGATGAALDTVNYEPGRGDPTKWGKSSDKYNRVERYWGSVAYLDGVHPSVITGRGYYGRMTATAYAVENKKLKKLWTFDTGTSSSTPGYGDGNHNSMVADVDGDGKQEIITGSTCIDDNGTLKWNTNTGHGDALHVGDLDPSNPGIEVWTCHEDSPYGVSLIDADTGKTIFRHNGSGDTGRCCADNVWAGNPGAELWGNGNEVNDVKGNTLNCRRPAINFLSYWDGDLEREILDGYTDSPATISKMTGDAGKTTITTLLSTDGYYTCNTTKGTPCLSADIFGDWREELIVRKADGTGIRIYATTYDTDYRIQCLMHDPQYRAQVSAQNTAYNQPPHTSFYLGSDQPLPARPVAVVNGESNVGLIGAVMNTALKYEIKNAADGALLADTARYTLKAADSGYYQIIAADTGLALSANGDQIFKFVSSGEGYLIFTQSSGDTECLGGEGTVWLVTPKFDPITGSMVTVDVLDTAYYVSWGIDSAAASGDTVFGDREVERCAISVLPEKLSGAEIILTPCDAKNSAVEQAVITAIQNVTLYVGLDSRVENAPTWLADWNAVNQTIQTSNDVTFNLYIKTLNAGDTVTLGANGQSAGCMNYIVLASAGSTAMIGDVNLDGTVNTADAVELLKFLLTESTLTADQAAQADMDGNGRLNAIDLTMLKRVLIMQ